MMENVWNSIVCGIKSLCTYQPLIDALAVIIPMLVAACFKCIRQGLVNLLDNIGRGLKKSVSKKPEDKVNKTSIENDARINGMLYVLLDKAKASRVNLYRFHNGEHFSIDSPMFKYTCTHEALDFGVVPDTGVVKRFIVSNYSDYILPMFDKSCKLPGVYDVKMCPKQGNNAACKLIKTPMRVVKFVRDELRYSVFKYTLMNQGTDVMYSVMLYKGNKNNPIGIVNFHYLNNCSLNEAVSFCELCNTIMELQHLLD